MQSQPPGNPCDPRSGQPLTLRFSSDLLFILCKLWREDRTIKGKRNARGVLNRMAIQVEFSCVEQSCSCKLGEVYGVGQCWVGCGPEWTGYPVLVPKTSAAEGVTASMGCPYKASRHAQFQLSLNPSLKNSLCSSIHNIYVIFSLHLFSQLCHWGVP